MGHEVARAARSCTPRKEDMNAPASASAGGQERAREVPFRRPWALVARWPMERRGEYTM